MSREAFHNFIKQNEAFQERNEDYLSQMKYAEGEIEKPSPELSTLQSTAYSDISNFITLGASAFQDSGIIADPVISAYMDSLNSMLEKIKMFRSAIVEQNRSFKDIVLHGPENMGEVALMECATSVLEPHELHAAVTQDLPVSSVLGKIEDSKRMHDNRDFSIQHQQRITEEQQKQANIKKDVQALSGEYGVLGSISKSMKYTENIVRPSLSPDESQKSEQRGI